MTAQRKRRALLNWRTGVMAKRRALFELEGEMWDRMPPVGREFGSPDFDRLMEEDFRLRRGVFDPELVIAGKPRRLGVLKGKLAVPSDFDAALPEEIVTTFEGGVEIEFPEKLPVQPTKPL